MLSARPVRRAGLLASGPHQTRRASPGWPPSTQASHRKWLSAVREPSPGTAGDEGKCRAMPHSLTSTLQGITSRSARRAGQSAAAAVLALAGAACSVAGAGPAGAVAAHTDCAAVRIISARADGEDPGPGVIGSLAKLIAGQLSASVTRQAVAYPAALNGWARSAAKGDKAIKSDLTSAARRCPSQVFVLLGYSQGAEIVGDALGGGGASGLGPVTAGVPASVARKVVAVIQYSDPRRVPGLPFDKGSARG